MIPGIVLMNLWGDYEDINHGDTEARRDAEKARKPDFFWVCSALSAVKVS